MTIANVTATSAAESSTQHLSIANASDKGCGRLSTKRGFEDARLKDLTQPSCGTDSNNHQVLSNRTSAATIASKTTLENGFQLRESVFDANFIHTAKHQLESFYVMNPRIKESHGLKHALAVHTHAVRAISCSSPQLSPMTSMEIQLAALFHDVDDRKYFPDNKDIYTNAKHILAAVRVSTASCDRVLSMIKMVSCSENGNSVDDFIINSGMYFLLIPRWSDRLEAVGAIGVVRCYQYNMESKQPLFTAQSPRAKSVQEVWDFAAPQRFEAYQVGGGTSTDMISHYYDKLLHIACPPKHIVRNKYLEEMAEESSKELIEVCVRFGQSGAVDVSYIKDLAKRY